MNVGRDVIYGDFPAAPLKHGNPESEVEETNVWN